MVLFKTIDFISFIVLVSLFGVGISEEEKCGGNDELMWKGTMDGQDCIAKQRQEDTPGLVPSGKIDVDGITFYLYCSPEEKSGENQNALVEEPDEVEDEGFVENEQVETDQGENEQVKNEQVEEDSSNEDVQIKKDEL